MTPHSVQPQAGVITENLHLQKKQVKNYLQKYLDVMAQVCTATLREKLILVVTHTLLPQLSHGTEEELMG